MAEMKIKRMNGGAELTLIDDEGGALSVELSRKDMRHLEDVLDSWNRANGGISSKLFKDVYTIKF